jgi:hypothetical protein
MPVAFAPTPERPRPCDRDLSAVAQDQTVRIEHHPPEKVAYDLMRDITFDDPTRPLVNSAEFRRYLLDLYAECLDAVKGKRPAQLVDGDLAGQKAGSEVEGGAKKRRLNG